jgi:hypothetical protein
LEIVDFSPGIVQSAVFVGTHKNTLLTLFACSAVVRSSWGQVYGFILKSVNFSLKNAFAQKCLKMSNVAYCFYTTNGQHAKNYQRSPKGCKKQTGTGEPKSTRAEELLEEKVVLTESQWKGAGKGKRSSKGKKTDMAQKQECVKKAAWENRLLKWFLRPYVEQTGSPFNGAVGSPRAFC